jgi:Nucleotidyltransferase of unknown function (DUF6036)
MRRPLDEQRLRNFLRELGRQADADLRIYLTGGATAVLCGWRRSTVDVDLKMEPDRDELFRAIPRLKEELQINVELASPDQFIPELPGWKERSLFITKEGRSSFYHYDLYAQALAKIERGHERDLADVREMLKRGLIQAPELRRLFDAIEPSLFRYPAINPKSFRAAVEAAAGSAVKEP